MAMQTPIRVILIFLLFLIPTKPSSSFHSCKENERQALLNLKHSAVDPSRRLSSWVGLDCCKWRGIGCNNKTGHVVKLDLRNPFPIAWGSIENEFGIFGNDPDITYEEAVLKFVEVNPSLVELKHLSYLDLSWNNFSGIKIPNFFGSFQELRYLNLSSAFFGGHVPHHLGNLSALNSLDLSSSFSFSIYYSPYLPALIVDTLDWISNLISLQHLDMSKIDLSKVPADSFGAITSIASNLVELQFVFCQINISRFLYHRNFSSLVILGLGCNLFDSLNPNIFGNLSSLEVLDLSDNSFYGPVPEFLGALPFLKELYLNSNELSGSIPVSPGEFPVLEVLNLHGNKLNGSIPESVGELSSLEELVVDYNSLTGSIPMSLSRLPLLRILELGANNLNGSVPVFLGLLFSLEELSIHDNNLIGSIPLSLSRLPLLRRLELGGNNLNGSVPVSLGELSSLEILNLQNNRLTGTLPVSIGQLSELEEINVSGNLLEGVLSELHFAKLSKLTSLVLSNNSFKIEPSCGWVLPGNVVFVDLAYCRVGPNFPCWLRNQIKLHYLDMSHTGISDSIPNWFQHLTAQLTWLDLSFNHIHGNVPNLVNSNKLQLLKLKSNQFEGQLPHFPPSLRSLDLSDNTVNGMIPDALSNIRFLDLSNNQIHGNIPDSLCEMENLYFLDLSKNHFYGTLPQCWRKLLKQLLVLDFSSNQLTGSLTDSVYKSPRLKSLRLSKNMFHGGIPDLRNCTSLLTLDLGENALSGQIPTWIGGRLFSLKILRLRSNKFSGGISPLLCRLGKLQILDIAHNNFSGTIPRCFSNFSAMVFNQSGDIGISVPFLEAELGKLTEVINGKEQEYQKILSLLVNVDLSCNSLVGEIPQELTGLSGLLGLNLSKNHLVGSIPENIDQMRSLFSLDLSKNNLSGQIPETIALLFALSALNLSNNNLTGAIPVGYQLQTLTNPSIYEGNNLCGAPLKKKCFEDERPHSATHSRNKGEEKKDEFWFNIGLASGIIVGFWSVWFVLFFKETWKHAYFRLIDDIKEKFLVVIEVRMKKIQNMLKNDGTL